MLVLGDNEAFDVVDLPPPSDDDIERLIRSMARRATALIERRFEAIDDDGGTVLDGAMAEAMQKVPATPCATSAWLPMPAIMTCFPRRPSAGGGSVPRCAQRSSFSPRKCC